MVRIEASDPMADGVERARPMMKFSTDYFQFTMMDELLLSVYSRYEILDDIYCDIHCRRERVMYLTDHQRAV
ncbi:hypothetical protein PanWU01x14_306530 [Parasponia andersonii]|uniref:Uncharacterized protein n=1 Tax=Parasponia andersonii TaxID=3476 RepID=A0A2P5ARU1_PARAD|nr:hypothetical protein PanWU01x14_306530 [Parasponia andersonii]